MSTATNDTMMWLSRFAPAWLEPNPLAETSSVFRKGSRSKSRVGFDLNGNLSGAHGWVRDQVNTQENGKGPGRDFQTSQFWERCKDAFLRYRLPFILLMHLVAFGCIYLLAYLLRVDAANFSSEQIARLKATFAATVAVVALVKLGIFVRMGSHRGWYRHATFADLVNLAESAALGFVLLLGICLTGRYIVNHALATDWALRIALLFADIPLSVILLDFAGTILVLGGVRVSTRLYRERYAPIIEAHKGERTAEAVLVAMASNASLTIIRELREHRSLNMRVVGIVDPNPHLHDRMVGGVPVLGWVEDLPKLVKSRKIKAILAPIPAASATALRTLSEKTPADIRLLVVPGMDAVLSGNFAFQPRDVDIHDLLCREPVCLQAEPINLFLQGKTILVTGAAGSIGSEICRQTLAFRPRSLILLDHSENGLFEIERGLKRDFPDQTIVPVVANISDASRLRSVFAEHRPDVVFHAAAYKHVPMMESNPVEAIKNNVVGTKTLVDQAIESGVESFVLISTDKAVNPASVMGACKRLCEMYLQIAKEQAKDVRLVTVRFGNVLGSSGSVVPLFKEQIREGGPVTVTHPEMTRYFMTIPEASQLVLQAGAYGKGCEIFTLDMGQPIKILDLAKDLIKLSGMRNIDIAFTGLRPGEKLHEELYHDGAEHLPTPHPKIFAVKPQDRGLDRLRNEWSRLERVAGLAQKEAVALLEEFVPEYRPWPHSPSGGKNTDYGHCNGSAHYGGNLPRLPQPEPEN